MVTMGRRRWCGLTIDEAAVRRIRLEVQQDAFLRSTNPAGTRYGVPDSGAEWQMEEFERRLMALLEKPEPGHLVLRFNEQQWLSDGDTLRIDFTITDEAVVTLDGAQLDVEVAGNVG